jgi:hypothetical protein
MFLWLQAVAVEVVDMLVLLLVLVELVALFILQ